ncbi:DsbA family protein [Bifidobacterium catenulatum]|uniref:DSBA oxidoreductase n=1 Tax=Bifidobacterium catenulatum PV20-2 TaxID=1447716 RepID=A0A0A7I873_9BIFI|nr:DsbA family protein [Bifidobacterium catenulatum]AIZ15004.1 DSBA oxidoreductase [Bifidobacterium catenulatum PV20-2]
MFQRTKSDKKKQRFALLITACIIAALIIVAFVGFFLQGTVEKHRDDVGGAYDLLQNVESKPSNATKQGGLASFVGSEEQAPTVEIYLDPLCPACGQVDRILNDTLEKMYEEGQIKIEIHPLNFLDGKSTDTYSSRVSSAIAYISEHDPEHIIKFIAKIYDESNQPSEVNYAPVPDKEIIQWAKEAGVPSSIAKKSVDGRYVRWVTYATNYTITRDDLIAVGKEGFATPLIRIDGNIWSMDGLSLDDLSNDFVHELTSKKSEIGNSIRN